MAEKKNTKVFYTRVLFTQHTVLFCVLVVLAMCFALMWYWSLA